MLLLIQSNLIILIAAKYCFSQKTMAQLTIVDRLGSGSFGYVMRIKLFHFLETGDFDNVSLDLCFPLTIMPLECML